MRPPGVLAESAKAAGFLRPIPQAPDNLLAQRAARPVRRFGGSASPAGPENIRRSRLVGVLLAGLQTNSRRSGPKGAVKQAVAGLARLAPDHAAVVRTDITVEARLHQRLDDLVDIQAARSWTDERSSKLPSSMILTLRMCMKPMRPWRCICAPSWPRRWIWRSPGFRCTGTGCWRGCPQSQEAVQVFLTGDDAGQAEDGIGWVVRMNGHHNAALLGHGNDLLEEFLKVFPSSPMAP